MRLNNGDILLENLLDRIFKISHYIKDDDFDVQSQEFRRDQIVKMIVHFNMDPGIVTLSSMQLLTTKDYAHRIYLSDGIFMETTFLFKKDGIHTLEWTYPDYKTNISRDFFIKCRNFLKNVNKTPQ